MATKTAHVILYQLQPFDSSDARTDHALYLRADERSGIRPLKLWVVTYIDRMNYHYDKTLRCYTIERKGKYWLEQLRKDKCFTMLHGIGE